MTNGGSVFSRAPFSLAKPAASSSVVSAERPSPPDKFTIAASASSVREQEPAKPRFSSESARRTMHSISAPESECSSITREREMSAEFTSKNGFSVVAPTSTTVRFSTACKSESCWLRLKRWISSTNRIVRAPVPSRRFSAAAISRRKSATVPPMAETSTNVARVVSAMMCAMLVLPVPAGPYKMMDESVSASIAA